MLVCLVHLHNSFMVVYFCVYCFVIFFLQTYNLLSLSFYSFLSSMLEKLFYTMSLRRHFMSLDHLADVVCTGLEYVP